MHISSCYAKYWGAGGNFAHGSFPEEGQKQKSQNFKIKYGIIIFIMEDNVIKFEMEDGFKSFKMEEVLKNFKMEDKGQIQNKQYI